jgi:pimeloyl-ACP methyl ester carboxylesterase
MLPEQVQPPNRVRGDFGSEEPLRHERITLHGHDVGFIHGGKGEAVLFVHGIAGSYDTWDVVLPGLAESFYVIAPDLLGHGRSDKPKGDYSLGAYASGLRDLLQVLDVDRVTVVGHSMGGGVAMQFAYQFPQLIERLVLVDSGGLGPEVTPFLRAATLPGADLVLSVATSDRVTRMAAPFVRAGMRMKPSIGHVVDHLAALQDRQTRRAFITTARTVLDVQGQRIDARDRLYLAQSLPMLIMWGERDRFIPVEHGKEAHNLVPTSRMELFAGAGHFPHRDDPDRFVGVLTDFIETTEPAELSAELLKSLVLADPLARPRGQV